MIERLAVVLAAAVVVALVVAVVRAAIGQRDRARQGRPLAADLAIEDAGVPTVLYFFGVACPTCRVQRREIDRLRSTRPALNVVAIDAAAEPALSAWAGVLTVPSTAVLDPARRLRAINHGFARAEQLAAQIEALAA